MKATMQGTALVLCYTIYLSWGAPVHGQVPGVSVKTPCRNVTAMETLCRVQDTLSDIQTALQERRYHDDPATDTSTSSTRVTKFYRTATAYQTLDNQLQLLKAKQEITDAKFEAAELKVGTKQSELMSDIQATKSDLDATHSEFQTTKSDLEAIKSEFQATKSDLEAIKSEFQATKSDLQATKSEFQTTKSDLEATKSEFQTTKSDLEATKSEFQTTKSDLEATKSEFQATKSDLEATKSEFQTTKSDLEAIKSEFQTTLSELQASTSEFQTTLSDLQATKSAIQTTKSDLEVTKSALEATKSVLDSGLQAARSELEASKTELEAVKQELQATKMNFVDTVSALSQGSTYIRWGRTSCPKKTTLVYAGLAGGKDWDKKGGGTNSLCLTSSPQLTEHSTPSGVSHLYGGEYQTWPPHTQHDVPCSVCLTPHSSTIMIPATRTCPPGWTAQYSGHLTAHGTKYFASQYTCMDSSPEHTPGGQKNTDGHLFYPVVTVCGTLPCPPYSGGKIVTCVVCSK